MRLYRWLVESGGGPGATAVIAMHPRRGQTSRDHERRRGRVDRALFRLASLGVIDDLTTDGPEITVHLAAYDRASIDGALLAYLERIEPGNEAGHLRIVGRAPEPFEERLAAHLRALAEAIYLIVAAARLTAIENMYELARGDVDGEHLRRRINDYLGDGPAAAVLAAAIARSEIDVPRFVASLETLPPADADALTAASARQREAYPDHPLLWFATALGSAREPTGDQQLFRTALTRSLMTFGQYGVAEAQAAAGVGWLIRRLRSENEGRRWEWTAVVFEAWDAIGYGISQLADAEDEALALAQQGQYRERELVAVMRRRLRRRANEAGALADRYTGVTVSEERGTQ